MIRVVVRLGTECSTLPIFLVAELLRLIVLD